MFRYREYDKVILNTRHRNLALSQYSSSPNKVCPQTFPKLFVSTSSTQYHKTSKHAVSVTMNINISIHYTRNTYYHVSSIMHIYASCASHCSKYNHYLARLLGIDQHDQLSSASILVTLPLLIIVSVLFVTWSTPQKCPSSGKCHHLDDNHNLIN